MKARMQQMEQQMQDRAAASTAATASPQQAIAAGQQQTKECSSCHKSLASSVFSSKQWQAPTYKRRCKECVVTEPAVEVAAANAFEPADPASIITCLQRVDSRAAVLATACTALTTLLKSGERDASREMAVRHSKDVVQSVVAALRKHPFERTLHRAACLLIEQVVESIHPTNDSAQPDSCALIQQLSSAMKATLSTHRAQPAVVAAALDALTTLAQCPPLRDALVDNGGVELLAQQLDAHQADPDAVYTICMALAHLTGVAAASNDMRRLHVAARTVRIMARYVTDERVHGQCQYLLFSMSPRSRDVQVFSLPSPIRHLLIILLDEAEQKELDSEAILATIHCLQVYVFDAATRSEFHYRAGGAVLLQALTMQRDNKAVVLAVCAMLRHISSKQADPQQLAELVHAATASNIFKLLKQHFANDAAICTVLCQTFNQMQHQATLGEFFQREA